VGAGVVLRWAAFAFALRCPGEHWPQFREHVTLEDVEGFLSGRVVVSEWRGTSAPTQGENYTSSYE
jgi:hypothetical protein